MKTKFLWSLTLSLSISLKNIWKNFVRNSLAEPNKMSGSHSVRKLSHLAGAARAENLCEEEMNCAAAISIILWQNFVLILRMEGEIQGSASADHSSRNSATITLREEVG